MRARLSNRTMKRETKKLADVGEDALVEALTARLAAGPGVIAGPGDDCAVLKSDRVGWVALLKADCIVEGVHYARAASPGSVGWKAMARSISDIAAMGGLPRHALVTLVLPANESVSRVKAIYGGLEKAARQFDVSIVGGETSRAPGRGASMISVALSGEVERGRCVLRSGGKAGDALYVTGKLGGAGAGRHLRIQPRVTEARWLTERFRLRALMDLSDGLAKDLPRLAKASRVGFDLDVEALPRHCGCDVKAALEDGEDYELLFALSSRNAPRLEREWAAAFPKLPLTRIGALVANRSAGKALQGGWDHFRK